MKRDVDFAARSGCDSALVLFRSEAATEFLQRTLFLWAALAHLSAVQSASVHPPCKRFQPIYAFGDSITDTGNQVRTSPGSAPASHLPYGETYFKCPTGRYSDGRLMVDFLTTALNEGLLPPHVGLTDRTGSENFAVAGATALDLPSLHEIANVTSTTPISLDCQISSFNQDSCEVKLSDALVYFGEIGGNDYNYALAARRSMDVVESLISPVMTRISTALSDLISREVKHIVVQGQFPMGCISVYKYVLNGSATDKDGCIVSVNQISDEHNRQLKNVVLDIAGKHKDVSLLFFDTTSAYVRVLQNPKAYGFTNLFDPCYEEGLRLFLGPAFNMTLGNQTCSSPQNYINWDGVHFTEAMYRTLMRLFLERGDFASPSWNFLSGCTYF
ncbi:hypothetical protein KP509_04G085900 [Ceratopteris richardii]|uniref:GDSL esterase/lipase n=1 Tax=Ceratopteris richardii TaxID=49495 RepID=A0A8T2UXL8_CERRI|nr:hypothetical protein KP509_04G085900 [Ceratopteris richardii]